MYHCMFPFIAVEVDRRINGMHIDFFSFFFFKADKDN